MTSATQKSHQSGGRAQKQNATYDEWKSLYVNVAL